MSTFKQWYANLGEAVPLALVPELPVQTFRAENGRVFRMVRLHDIQVYGKNPLTLERVARAVAGMLYESGHSGTSRRVA